jgi:hypothetical protein
VLLVCAAAKPEMINTRIAVRKLRMIPPNPEC